MICLGRCCCLLVVADVKATLFIFVLADVIAFLVVADVIATLLLQ